MSDVKVETEDNIHVNFEKIMEPKLNYSEVYEKAAESILNSSMEYSEYSTKIVTEDIKLKVKKETKKKREFGLKKYKELSFQSSFENTMKSPTVAHAKEELVDLINYFLNELIKRGFSNNVDAVTFKTLLSEAISMYGNLDNIKELN